MKSTPGPVSTAMAAAIIWSGVGEVKIWPGQAASSMPWPTKPLCSGSCPAPPPDTNATLPGLSTLRRTNTGSLFSTTRSACAAANPARLSARKSSTWLMNFFMVCAPSLNTLCQIRAHRRDHQLAGTRARIDMAARTFAEKRRPALGREHVAGGEHMYVRHPRQFVEQRSRGRSRCHQFPVAIRNRNQYVHHRLAAHARLAPLADSVHAGGKDA